MGSGTGGIPLCGAWQRYKDLIRADFAINPRWDARMTLAIWRMGQVLHRQPGVGPFLLRRLSRLADIVWNRAFIGALLPPHVQVGPGIRLPHCGRGVVLHHTVRLGAGVTLYHQVTIGVRDDRSAAVVGDDVEIGAGAKILGPVHLGDGCRVGANAVVLEVVPAGATCVGVPAQVCARR